MIDVIIPAYNAHKTIKKTLYSIASQVNSDDINVYIVNDCSKKDYSDEIEFFSKFLKIKELKLNKNSGPGVARQFGIDNSMNEYIVFIDSDDVFANSYSIKRLYEEIKNNDYDEVISSFYSQKNNLELEEVVGDTTWLHGKIYRRSFLEKNNIRFNSSYANEDNGFNLLIKLHNAKIGTIYDFTYIWSYNENSITRKNNFEYNYKGIQGYIYNMSWAFENALEKGLVTQKFVDALYDTLVAVYYYYLEFINEKNVNNILKESKKLVDLYNKYPKVDTMDKNFVLCDEFIFMSKTFESIDLLNNNISFNRFLELVTNI